MEKAIMSTLEEMPRIQITTENRDVKDEKEFGWSKDPYKNSSVDDRRVCFCENYMMHKNYPLISYFQGSNRPVREWDVGKKDKEDFERDDRDRSRRERREKEDRPEKRRSISGSPGSFS
jgi:hypothetical protein